MTDRTPYQLRKLDDGRWQIYWNIRRANGKGWTTKRKTLDTTDRHEASIRLAEFTLSPAEKPRLGQTVGQAIDAYLTGYAASRGQEKSSRWKLRAPREAFGDYALEAITHDDIAAYTSRRMFGGYGKVKVQGATIRAEIVMLQAALNWAMERSGKEKRYHFTKPAGGAPRDLWLDEDQEAAVLDASADWPLDVQLFLRMGLTYGARRGAMLELEFGAQVDFRRRWIDFNRPGALETRKRRPEGPMTPEIHDLLVRRLAEKKGGRVLEGMGTNKRFRALMERAGFGWASAHILKHSALTLQLRGGVDITVASRTTKTSIHTIMKHYRHHTEDEMLEAMTARRKK